MSADRDTEWMALVCYARAAGAPDAAVAIEWAREAVGAPFVVAWQQACEVIDRLASIKLSSR